MTSPEDAFQELVDLFGSRGDQVLEIEIIPPSLGSQFLRDGCAVGISKKALVQAFTIARQIFFETCVSMSGRDLLSTISPGHSSSASGSETRATEIMLLFDCEHLTACNWRKRRLLAALLHTGNEDFPIQSSQLAQMLKTELTLLESYQCSPLHRHTKSPTLWSHRLWAIKCLVEIETPSAEVLRQQQCHELEVVLRAADLHPRNYYAFTYMRHAHQFLTSTAVAAEKGSNDTWRATMAEALLTPMLDWCLAHPRDISGWSFSLYVLDHGYSQQSRVGAIERVLRFALDVGWEGESLWTFVAQTVHRFGLENLAVRILSPVHQKEDSSIAVAGGGSWRTWLTKAQAYWACTQDRPGL